MKLLSKSNGNLARTPEEIEQMIEKAAEAYAGFLNAVGFDYTADRQTVDTPKRVAKAWLKDLIVGSITDEPNITVFPNDEGYAGLVIQSGIPIVSMCSHHHQPVSGVAVIAIIPTGYVIGLSKYARIAQWCARRGTLQEELCNDIAREIKKATDSENVGVYIQATHGCCENRGIMAHSSLTQTTVLQGAFKNDPGVKKEFMDNIKLQQEFAPR